MHSAAERIAAARKRRRVKQLLLLLGLLLVLGVAAYLHFVADLRWQRLVEEEDHLRGLIAGHPVLAFVVGFGAYFALSLIPGTSGKSVVFGWLFGFLPAVVLIDCGLTAAALVSFTLSRYVFQAYIHRRFAPAIAPLDAAVRRDGGLYLLTLRLLHVPYTFVNYLSAVTVVRMSTFWWTTQLGLLPGTVVFAYAGSRLPSLRDVGEQGAWSLLDPQLALALVLLSGLPLAVRWGLRLWWGRPGMRASGGCPAPGQQDCE